MSQLLTEKHSEILESEKAPMLAEADKHMMAVLLENQEKEMDRLIAEGTVSGDIDQFTKIFLPLARRIYPSLIANDILGVQPMNGPQGFIYSMSPRYTGESAYPADSTRDIASSKESGVVLDLAVTVVTTADTLTLLDSTITGAGGATGTIVYVEGTKVLVKKTNATAFVDGEAVTGVTGQADDTIAIAGIYSNEALFQNIFKSYTGTYTTADAEQLGYDMREMGFEVTQSNIVANSRKLKGEYSIEMYQDMKAMHGLNADVEIMNMMEVEMRTEMDREVIGKVTTDWATIVKDFATGIDVDAIADARFEIDKYRTLAIRLAHESRLIGKDTRRGSGNTMVVSPAVATVLEQLKGYKAAEVASNVANTANQAVIGSFEGKKLIVDNFANSDFATVLYKGSSRQDAMGYFAPYVPLSFTKITHEASGQPGIILSTRYGLTQNPIDGNKFARTVGIDLSGTIINA